MERFLSYTIFASLLTCVLVKSLPSNDHLLVNRDLEQVREAYRGIHWDIAAVQCDPANFDILVEGTRMAVEVTNYKTNWEDLYFWNPAWNRYFVWDSTIPHAQGGWASDKDHHHVLTGIFNVVQQIKNFPVAGKKNRAGEWSSRKQISYRCKEEKLYHKCANGPNGYGTWEGPSAYTAQPTHSEDKGTSVNDLQNL